MECSRDRFEALGDPRTRSGRERYGDDLESLLAYRLELRRLGAAPQLLERHLTVGSSEINGRVQLDELGEREGTRTGRGSGDALPLRLRNEVPEERAPGNGDEEARVDEDRDRLYAGEALLDCRYSTLDLPHDLAGTRRLAD